MTCDRCDRTVPPSNTRDNRARLADLRHLPEPSSTGNAPHCDGWNRDGDDCGNDCCDDALRLRLQLRLRRTRTTATWCTSYDYKPRPVFHGTGPLFLGPEIEIETPYDRYCDCADIATGRLGDLGYLKEDGSIGDGFEIVTHPMSYEWAIEQLPLGDAHRARRRRAARPPTAPASTCTCPGPGSPRPCHAYRWMKFIYRNEHHVTRLARPHVRASGRRSPTTTGKPSRTTPRARRSDRYRAINTGNTDTFELRVFASSLDPRQVQAALAFAAASVEYTRELTVGDDRHAAAAGTGRRSPPGSHDRPAYAPLRAGSWRRCACVC